MSGCARMSVGDSMSVCEPMRVSKHLSVLMRAWVSVTANQNDVSQALHCTYRPVH